MECEHHIFWFVSHTFIFFKICQMVICPVRGTYNHVQIFFAQQRKKAFKLVSPKNLWLINPYSCFKFLSWLRNSNFYPPIVLWWHVRPSVHVTTRLIWGLSINSTVLLSYRRSAISTETRQFRGKNMEYKHHIYLFVRSSYFYFFQNMSDGCISRERDI